MVMMTAASLQHHSCLGQYVASAVFSPSPPWGIADKQVSEGNEPLAQQCQGAACHSAVPARVTSFDVGGQGNRPCAHSSCRDSDDGIQGTDAQGSDETRDHPVVPELLPAPMLGGFFFCPGVPLTHVGIPQLEVPYMQMPPTQMASALMAPMQMYREQVMTDVQWDQRWAAMPAQSLLEQQQALQSQDQAAQEVPQRLQPKQETTSARRRRGQAQKRQPRASSTAWEHTIPESSGGLDDEQCDELLRGINAGGGAQDAAIAKLHDSVLWCSFHPVGCRVVQLALQESNREIAAKLILELHGHVREALASPHANFVIQKVIELMPTMQTKFIVDELIGFGVPTARHRCGCRILCRLLEYSPDGESTLTLIDEVLVETKNLIHHSYGHHVIISILEHGSIEQRRKIVDALSKDLLRCAQHRFMSNVVIAALTNCSEEDQANLVARMQGDLLSMAQGQYSSRVVKVLAFIPRKVSQEALQSLALGRAQLLENRHGQQVLEDLGLVAPTTATMAAAGA